eukprot:CAMPEP_0197866784 /NCGR_PEP_ID=MMETSP1438-20131217/44404_1 /TAXON_ID=1461541 /ORGANISM="Pterosperma sp., Strain CCMP1384" /LENGTH=50 /DNA_ID=CAMNT_0043485379 /DNA_START=164 /DNA_END=316 /DNA_ORIENTATION=+
MFDGYDPDDNCIDQPEIPDEWVGIDSHIESDTGGFWADDIDPSCEGYGND